MSEQNVNITIGGPKNPSDYTYKTVVLKSNLSFASQIGEENTKYVIKWNFDLGGQTVNIPAGCILDFDGGVLSNGTLVGNDTYLAGDKSTGDNISASVTLEGTWKHNAVVKVDSTLSSSSTNPVENRVVKAALNQKVDAVPNKGLSSNDYSDTDKAKLDNYPEYSELSAALNGKVSKDGSKVLSDVNFSQEDKNKLDNISTTVDPALDPNSTNPVQNKVVTAALEGKADSDSVYSKEEVDEALSGKAGKAPATVDREGLMSAEDKAKLNSIQPNANANPNAIEHILVNGKEASVDTDSKTASIECVTLNDTTHLLDPAIIPPLNQYKNVIEYPTTSNFPKPGETNKIYISRETNNIYCWRFNQSGVEGAYYPLVGSGGGGLSPELLEKLIEIISIIWPENLPSEYPNVIEWILARLDALEDNPQPVPPTPDPDYPTIDYTYKFRDLVSAFDAMPEINGVISSDATVSSYLKDYYDEAEAQFKSGSSPYFQRSNFKEIEGYSEIPGLYGTYKGSYELAFDAMTAWLMAMCLSELKPSGNDTPGVGTSNNQTEFFKTAYNFKGNGRSVPLYNNYNFHCDPMHARLVAGFVYAKVRGKKSNDTVQSVRNKLNGSIISTTGWTNNQKKSLKCETTGGSDSRKLGFLVDSRQIIPDAPGPYIPGTENRHDKPYTEGQSSSLFYTTEQTENWALDNYIVDYLVDEKVRQNYIMGVTHDANEASHLTYIKSLWGIGSTSANSYSHEKKNEILNATTACWAQDRFFFGSRNVNITGITKGSADGLHFTDWYMFKFDSGAAGGGNDYTIAGPFSDIENKIYSSGRSDSTISSTYPFFKFILELGDNSRWPTYSPEYGRRRRPLGGLTTNTGTHTDSRSQIYGDVLNGLQTNGINAYFADSDDDAAIATFNSNDDWPHDPAASYPSGHTSQTMTVALMLGQIYQDTDPSKLIQYVKNAYDVGVGRAIGRYHWLSDIIYGRLFATMVLPLINATDTIINGYETAKSYLTGSAPSGEGEASVVYNTGTSNKITISVHNDSDASITVNTVRFSLVGYPTSPDNGTGYAEFTNPNGVTIAPGDEEIVIENATIADAQYTFCDAAPNTFNNGNGGDGRNVRLMGLSGGSWIYYDSSKTVGLPIGTLYKDGMNYTISYNGVVSTAVDESSGGTGDTTLVNINITNNTGSRLILKNKIRFIIDKNEVVYRTSGLVLGNLDPLEIENGDTAPFPSVQLDSDDLALRGYPFSTTYDTHDGHDYGSNIVLYDGTGTAILAPAMGENPSTHDQYTFEGDATYNITLGSTTPQPTPGLHTINLRLINNTSANIPLDGDAVLVVANPDIYGNYSGWEGPYNRTGHLSFNIGAITLVAYTTRTVTIETDVFNKHPLDPQYFTIAGRRSNVLLYVGGDSEKAICQYLDPSIIFTEGGTYDVVITSYE